MCAVPKRAANRSTLTRTLSLGKGEGKSPLPACGERIKVRGCWDAEKFMSESD
jgi:hypothetical protein